MFKRKIKRADAGAVPAHVGVIMDGNGRWAAGRGLPRKMGHRQGSKNVEAFIKTAARLGIGTVTLYAFSTENWKRPKEEVDALFDILREFFDGKDGFLQENGIKLQVLGERSALPDDLQKLIAQKEEETRGNAAIVVNVAVNYGARAEIVTAVNALLKGGAASVTEEEFAAALYTAGQSDPDLIIRTGGEVRLSNFLLYQSAYSELYFTDTLWPDFKERQFLTALEDGYARRKRNFGGV